MYSSINTDYEENVFFDFKLVPQDNYLVMHGGGVNSSDCYHIVDTFEHVPLNKYSCPSITLNWKLASIRR